MGSKGLKPAHANVATEVATLAGWPSEADSPLGTPVQSAIGAPEPRRRKHAQAAR